MSETTSTPTPARVYHEISLESTGGSHDEFMSASKETITLRYAATWRGRPVAVEMHADKYRHASGWSDWRIYCEQAGEGDTEGYIGAQPLTDTARHRLGDEYRPHVLAWIDGPDYPASLRSAYGSAVRREFHDLRGSTSSARTALRVNADKMSPKMVDRLTRAADAYDVYDSIMGES